MKKLEPEGDGGTYMSKRHSALPDRGGTKAECKAL